MRSCIKYLSKRSNYYDLRVTREWKKLFLFSHIHFKWYGKARTRSDERARKRKSSFIFYSTILLHEPPGGGGGYRGILLVSSEYNFVGVVDSAWMHSKLKRFYCDFVLNRKNWDEHCSRTKLKRKEKKGEKGECIQRYQCPDSTVLYSFLLSLSFLLGVRATFKCRIFARMAYWCLYVQCSFKKEGKIHKYLFDGIVAMDGGYWIHFIQHPKSKFNVPTNSISTIFTENGDIHLTLWQWKSQFHFASIFL